MKTGQICYSSINRTSFTFRELRSFRALYISQNLLGNTSIGLKNPRLSNTREIFKQNQEDVRNTANTKAYSYTYFGNAEAISPAHRRRFRESQKANNLPNISANESFPNIKRKVFHFPTKRAKTIYSFSQFNGIRSLLVGGTLCRNIETNSDKNIFLSNTTKNVTPLSLSFADLNQKLIQKGFSTVSTFESTFKFLPTFRIGGSFFFLSTSIYSWKEEKIRSRNFQFVDLVTAYLYPIENIFFYVHCCSTPKLTTK